jgi:16S rRNA G966 N2-methylase RsmD
MFLGTTTAPVRAYMHSALSGRRHLRIFEPFAGNFAFTQVARRSVPEARIISGDVGIYSVMLGRGLRGDPVRFQVSEWLSDRFPQDPAYTDVERAAYVVFLSDVAKYAVKMAKVEYARRMVSIYQRRQAEIVAGLAQKIASLARLIGDNWEFHSVDAVKLLEGVQPGDLVFYDPPYWVGGYEKMFAFLEENIGWDRPSYTVFNDGQKERTLLDLLRRGATLLWRTEKEIDIEGMAKVFEFHHRVDGAIYLYTNDRTFKPAAGSAALLGEHDPRLQIILPTDEMKRCEPVRVIEIDRKRFNHYRHLWTHKARMKSAENVSYAILVGNRVVGVAGVASGMAYSSDLAVIVSDACPASSYMRLSRLVLYVLLTDEILASVNRRTLWEHKGYTTKVYTDDPVSMKYRSLFDLAKRKKGTSLKYELTYSTRRMVAPTIQEAYLQWFDRYGTQRTDNGPERRAETA